MSSRYEVTDNYSTFVRCAKHLGLSIAVRADVAATNGGQYAPQIRQVVDWDDDVTP